MLASPYPNKPNSLPPQGLCTRLEVRDILCSYHRAWHIVGLKKYLVMNEEGKRRKKWKKLLTSSFPKRIFQRPGEAHCAVLRTWAGSSQGQGPVLPSFSWPTAGMVWKIQFTGSPQSHYSLLNSMACHQSKNRTSSEITPKEERPM